MSRFRPVLNQHGVTEQQWRILRVLLDEDGLEPRQLCERCLISSPSIAGVLMRMEEAGLIKRERMEHDQRRVKVTVTAATKKLGKSIAPIIEREYLELEKKVGVKQLQQVYDTLDTLLQNLDSHEETATDG
ncbi:MAG: homoprotocatechuate degradation operon regulator HpaR [Candidatus Obscuribacterales bacterium]|nr:homoprotocatechuate degradation operon regulator HpaR [Candidatus Obscuribacterales bacterium]